MDLFHRSSFSRKELCKGLSYLAFELCFLSRLLFALNRSLPISLSTAAVNFSYFLINFCVVVLIFRRHFFTLWTDLRHHFLDVIPCSILFFLAYEGISFFLSRVICILDPEFISLNDQTIRSLVSENFPLMFVGTVFLAPVAEEFLYRGVLFRGLYDHSPIAAWIISAVVFSAVHLSGAIGNVRFVTLMLCFIQYLPAGLLLAASYRHCGSLLSPIFIHIAVNFTAIMALR